MAQGGGTVSRWRDGSSWETLQQVGISCVLSFLFVKGSSLKYQPCESWDLK